MCGGTLVLFAVLSQIQDVLLLLDASSTEIGRAEVESQNLRFTTVILYVVEISVVYYYSILKGKNEKIDLIYFGVFYLLISFAGSAFLEIVYRYTAHFTIFNFYLLKDTITNMKTNRLISAVFISFVLYIPISKFTSVTEEHPILKYYSVFDSDKSEIDRIIRNSETPLLLL